MQPLLGPSSRGFMTPIMMCSHACLSYDHTTCPLMPLETDGGRLASDLPPLLLASASLCWSNMCPIRTACAAVGSCVHRQQAVATDIVLCLRLQVARFAKLPVLYKHIISLSQHL